MSIQPRSPNYPRISLARILSRLRKYQSNISADIQSEEAIACALGFTGVTGASLPILSALKKFKLLEADEAGFKFSDSAFKAITLNAGNPLYADLIERIAFEPDLFFDIRERFGKAFPPVEQFKDFLLVKEFVPKRVPEVIEIYRQTYELVSSVRDDYEKLPQPTPHIKKSKPVADSSKKGKNADGEQEWNFDLADGIQIAVKIVGAPSVSAMNKLADFWKNNEHFWKAEEAN